MERDNPIKSEKMTRSNFISGNIDSQNDLMTLSVRCIAFGIGFEILLNENKKQQ
jgi:hypothetical protein